MSAVLHDALQNIRGGSASHLFWGTRGEPEHRAALWLTALAHRAPELLPPLAQQREKGDDFQDFWNPLGTQHGPMYRASGLLLHSFRRALLSLKLPPLFFFFYEGHGFSGHTRLHTRMIYADLAIFYSISCYRKQ